MAIIFLDIDGVLNDDRTRERCCGVPGISPEKVRLLKYIVDQTRAQIVLISTWKDLWDYKDKNAQDNMGIYLDGQLAAEGLKIIAKTQDEGYNRGQGIMDYLYDNPTDAWVVLDDDVFQDYEELGILPHLVQTSWTEGGLTRELAMQAVHMIDEQVLRHNAR